MHSNRNLRIAQRLCWLVSALLSSAGWALPDDNKQPIDIDGPQGCERIVENEQLLYICRGTTAAPAQVTQGSLKISGTEIRTILRNDALQTITASGSPARFEQQPSAAEAIVHSNATKIVFTNTTQLLVMEGQAKLEQEGNVFESPKIEYNVKTTHMSATGTPGGESVHISLPVKQADTP
jgi:lipopolysaccharide export system protein LptA